MTAAVEIWTGDRAIDQPSHWDGNWARSDVERAVAELLSPTNALHQVLAKVVDGRSAGRGLDHGCGFGLVSALFEGWGWEMVGIDFAMEGLRRRVRPDMRLLGGDIRKMPFEDAQFDCAVSLGVVEHLAEGPSESLRELHRVLKPGARALISVPNHNPMRRLQNAVWPGGTRRMRYWVRPWSPSRRVPSTFYQYSFTPQEFEQELRQAGFAVEGREPYASFRGLADFEPWARVIQRIRTKGRRDAPPAGHGRTDAHRPGFRKRVSRYARGVYAESTSTLGGRVAKRAMGPLTGHMMAYYVRRPATIGGTDLA